MFIINKTPNTITLSQPDLQEYQDFFNHEDPRKNQSVTIYDRIKKVKSNQNQNLQLSSKLSNLSLTKTTFNNINTLYQFTKKTLKQINQKQEITLSQNFVTSMKESNLFIYNVAQKISTFIKTDKVTTTSQDYWELGVIIEIQMLKKEIPLKFTVSKSQHWIKG
ncbi:unnamed protein product [Paramecium primaurelia]|uniref:Uncharacterized protein n=1 Tax=Paramecium primaurelia TaxID=5886 RepID=A0A8S1JRS6_PARPR|nr:unnamed protein product [Paramecium primaurelia]